jgi:hypothetical protein
MDTIRMMRQVIAHPNDFFYDIQEPGRIRWYQSLLIVLLAYAAKMAAILFTGYAFQTREAYEISAFHEFIWLVVPWLTWCISNWGVSAILEGEGKFKEILHGSAFALVPYTVFIIPITLLTNVLALGESGMYGFLLKGVYVWTALLLLMKIKILHDFELPRLAMITFLSLVGIGIIWFIGILLFGLSNQFVVFVFDIAKEIRLRV